MSKINYLLWDRVPYYLKGVMEYYPDVFLFEFNQIQYTHLWQRLSSTNYIYTNGYEIRPTNWFMYAFQSIKGWLGFENHCQPDKVSYNLNKLAYYGYSQRLIQPDFTKVQNYTLSTEICVLAAKEYQQSTTAKLQKELIKSFFKVEPHFSIDYSYQRLNANHRFGDSWMKVDAMELVPMLDPQDDDLILELINSFDQKGSTEAELAFLKNSKFARISAQHYYDKAKNTPTPSFLSSLIWTDPRPSYLEQALAYHPEIEQKDPLVFIEHHLGKKAYQNAFNLLGLIDNPKLVLKFLLLIPEVIRNSLIEKDSSYAAILANYYLEKKQYPLAQQLYSKIEELSPAAAFSIAIKEKNHFKAYDIFKRLEKTANFSTSERNTLATIFFNAAEKEYETGSAFREKKMWQEAEQHYFRSLIQKKAAQHLNPSAENLENVFTHQRLYAQILVDADLALNLPETSNLASIQKAITLLRECHSNEKNEKQYQKIVLANALMRRVDTLREKISFTYPPYDGSTITQHKTLHQQEISTLIKTLEELIDLLKGTQDKTLLVQLGKADYLLADVHNYFDINDPNINQHYRQAMDAVPENPFYILRASEIFEQETDMLRARGVPKLKSMGFDPFDYLHWSDERWVKRDEIIYNIKDIHSAPLKDTTASSSWSLRF